MPVLALNNHIESTPDVLGGKPRIAGRRIAVQDIVVWHERMGCSADEIASEYSLTLSSIYAALAYYYDHREEIDESLRRGDELIDALLAENGSKVKERLIGK